MLQSDLCNYSDTYIVVKGTITVTRPNNDAYGKKLGFKNNAPFISCISKINKTLIDNAQDLDVVLLLYNLLEYIQNYGGADNNVNYPLKIQSLLIIKQVLQEN